MSTQNITTVENKPRLWLRLLIVILILLMIAGSLGYKKYLQIQEQIAMGSVPVPPSSVTVATATAGQWQNRLKAIGTLVASQGIDITSEVTGIVKNLNFESGQEINKGKLLLSLNNEIELAALTTAQAQYESANNQYQRSLKLKNKKFVTENELDQQRWAANSAKSQVQSAQAALDKKSILVPFSGKLGIRNVDVGDYVSPGTKLVTLQDVDTLYLDFTLPERNFTQLATQQPVKFKVRSYPEQEFEGRIQAWDPNLDVNTRNVNVRAVVDNSDGHLAPGMFAEIDVVGIDAVNVVQIPETAIFYNIYGEAVYVLEKPESGSAGDDAETAEIESNNPEVFILAARQVKVLYRENAMAGVVEGLQEGDTVVTSGQLKLFPSLSVVITDDVPETSEASEVTTGSVPESSTVEPSSTEASTTQTTSTSG